jgi:hypothetical protein
MSYKSLEQAEIEQWKRLTKKLVTSTMMQQHIGKVRITVDIRKDGSLGDYPEVSPVMQARLG